jgi:hypothetical protein
MTLDRYLETLTQKESMQKTAAAHYRSQSVDELATTVGIKLAANVCPKCVVHMTKTGSLYRCGCGMLKKAAEVTQEHKESPVEEEQSGVWKSAAVKLSQEKISTVVQKLMDAHDGDIVKVAAVCEAAGMDKEAIGPILGALGRAAKGAWGAGTKAFGKGATKTTGQRLIAGAKAGAKAGGEGLKQTGQVAKQYGKGIGEAYRTLRGKGMGRFQAALGTGVAAPGAAATALGAGGLGAYGLGRSMGRSAERSDIYKRAEALIEVGDGAGKVLAKMSAIDATPIPMEELRESLQEARAREDIPGRGRRTAILGGGLGALGAGGAGYGLGRIFGPKAGLVGAGIGALGGGAGGALLGKGYGQEEARADRAIAMLRALRAHRMGAQHGARAGARAGYVAGLRRGYGMRPGASAVTEKKPAV